MEADNPLVPTWFDWVGAAAVVALIVGLVLLIRARDLATRERVMWAVVIVVVPFGGIAFGGYRLAKRS